MDSVQELTDNLTEKEPLDLLVKELILVEFIKAKRLHGLES